ncbi:unnamed protein product [Rhizoctonia solani]|uniref:C2H2-type domain-containing protein n=1 Tax=Rhizoctonia solani TaxID=456999 RepID=A0A8H2X3B6_9AGAM|nr:unnamed protein product [Rhizoctonia solani]
MSNTQDSQAYDHSDFQGVIARLEVPSGNHNKASIDQLVEAFRAGAGRSATKAICSKCHDEGKHVVWDPKPASLKRHLYLHYDIKQFACNVPDCGRHFITKDQAVVHVMVHHTNQRDRKVAETWVVSLYDS